MIDYEEWKERRRSLASKHYKLQEKFDGRAPGNRPRDPEKERLLIKMGKARLKRWIESGKIEIVSPREWIWRIDLPAADSTD